ncbi:MAG: hypothetical protein R3Y43_03020 [Alphaproteobacteria bacterium]
MANLLDQRRTEYLRVSLHLEKGRTYFALATYDRRWMHMYDVDLAAQRHSFTSEEKFIEACWQEGFTKCEHIKFAYDNHKPKEFYAVPVGQVPVAEVDGTVYTTSVKNVI